MLINLNPLVQTYYYIHLPGKKDYALNLDLFENDKGTATNQILNDFQNDLIADTDTLYDYLQEFVKTPSFKNALVYEDFDSIFKNYMFDKNTYLLDIIDILDLSHSYDLVQYLKLISKYQRVQTLFESLDYSKHKDIIFTNPSRTNQYMFAHGVYPANMSSMGGTYSISLYEKQYNNSNKNSRLIKQFTNNSDLYEYIYQYNLTFDEPTIKELK